MTDKIFSGVMKILTFIGSILGGFLAVSLAINTLVYCPLNKAIAAETTKREEAICLESKLRFDEDTINCDKADKRFEEQLKTNQRILVMLARIETHMGIKDAR